MCGAPWTAPLRCIGRSGQRVDLVVEKIVLLELKTVPRLRPIHRAQVISYLKTLNLRVGLLVNFNVPLLKDGIQRIVY